MTLLREEMELAPAEPAPAINLGIILVEMGRKEEAVREVRACHHRCSYRVRRVRGARDFVHRLGPGSEGRGDPSKRGVGPPNLIRSWFNIGANYSNRGEDDKAEEAYRKALQIEPTFPDATRELGFTMLRRGIFRRQFHSSRSICRRAQNADDASEVRAALDVARKNAK